MLLFIEHVLSTRHHAKLFACTGILCFLKAYTTVLLGKTYVSTFVNGKIEDFHFYEKKAKVAFSLCFVASLYRATRAPSSESSLTKLLPREQRSAPQHQAAIALTCVCEGL